MKTNNGLATPAIIAIIAIILIGGGLWYANTTSNEDMMGEKAGDMIEKGDVMLKEGEEMMEEGEKMMKEGEAMMGKDIMVTLGALNNSGQTGKAMFAHMGDKTKVTVEIATGAGVPQPSHIHAGTCAAPGAIVYPLSLVVNGKAETILDASLETIGGKLPLVVIVHKSKEEAKIFTSCGELPKEGWGGAMMTEGDAMMEGGKTQ